jgi:hypothetical protein
MQDAYVGIFILLIVVAIIVSLFLAIPEEEEE